MHEFTQKDLVAYVIYSSKEIEKFSDKTINHYIEKLQNNLLNTKIGQVLFVIDLRLFNNFEFSADLNYSEIMAYAKLIYKRLLNYTDKSFTNEDIINESKHIYNRFSVRTAAEEVVKLGL